MKHHACDDPNCSCSCGFYAHEKCEVRARGLMEPDRETGVWEGPGYEDTEWLVEKLCALAARVRSWEGST